MSPRVTGIAGRPPGKVLRLPHLHAPGRLPGRHTGGPGIPGGSLPRPAKRCASGIIRATRASPVLRGERSWCPPLLESIGHAQDCAVFGYGHRWIDGEAPEASHDGHHARFAPPTRVKRTPAAHLEDTEWEEGTRVTLDPAGPPGRDPEAGIEDRLSAARRTRLHLSRLRLACPCRTRPECRRTGYLGARSRRRGFAERVYDVGGQPWIRFLLVPPDGNCTRAGEGQAGPNANLDAARPCWKSCPVEGTPAGAGTVPKAGCGRAVDNAKYAGDFRHRNPVRIGV